MSALANHAFAKMNGIGNEIVVVDMRDKPAVVTSEEARAVASPAGVHYDPLMVLQPPRVSTGSPRGDAAEIPARGRAHRRSRPDIGGEHRGKHEAGPESPAQHTRPGT